MRLRAMDDADFAWLLGEGPGPADAPRLSDGGIAPPEVAALLRRVSADMRGRLAGDVAWLMIAPDDEAVGMVSFVKAGDPSRPEIGYGVAPAHEGHGHCTAAIAALLPIARAAGFDGLTAETAIDNRASQRVLERNGFVRAGERVNDEDGALYQWALGWTR